MKVHVHTKFCLICLLTFVFHHCNHCHEEHDHGPEELHRHHRGMTEPEPGKFSVQDAENEQRYYIERLFDRYGENGRLTFFGLEKLLTNLGLGEIKVVEISHEDLGHDHVSHLDMLAVQEGRHSHSHGHAHEPVGPENRTASSVPAGRSHKCDPVKEALGAPAKSEDKHGHDHSPRPRHHRPHHHLDHGGAPRVHNGSAPRGQRGEPSRAPAAAEANKTQEQAELKPRKGRKDKGKRNNENSEVITPGLPPAHAQGEPYEHNRVHKPDRVHNPGHSHAHPEHSGHDPGHGHQDRAPDDEGELRHTRKREAPHVKKSAMYSAASHKDHGEDDHHHECLNGTQLLKHFGHGANSPISPTLFTYLCPALLYQIDSRLCIEHFDRLLVEDVNKEKHLIPEDKANIGASAWICGIISITVISLLSLLGVILVPIINQGCFKFLLTFLVALAVGTMSGDALLHLLPHVRDLCSLYGVQGTSIWWVG